MIIGLDIENPPDLNMDALPLWLRTVYTKYQQVSKHLSLIDVLFRLCLAAVIIVNFGVRLFNDDKAYTLTEKKLVVCSLTALFVGFHHSSLLFFPFMNRLTIHLYVTLLFVYVTMTFERFEGYLLVKPPDKDAIFLASYYIFITVLIPNVAAIVFIFFLIAIGIAGAIILQIFAGFGYDYRPWRDLRTARVENRAEIFRRNYKQMLNGYFYKHVPDLERDFVSLDEDPRLEEHSVITMNQAFSCANFKMHTERQKEKRATIVAARSAHEGSESADGLCSICYIPFKNGAYLIELPVCGHVFHYGCLGSWVDKNPTCPICRFDLYKHYSEQARVQFIRQQQTETDSIESAD